MSDYSMSATIIGAEELKRAFDDASGICQKALADALNRTAVEITVIAKDLAPHDHGHLKDSIHPNLAHATGNNIQAEVGTNLEYAIYQEYGTGIYSEYPGASHNPVTPKTAKALRWVGSDGAVHFARSIKGVKPKFFMKQAKEKAMPLLTTHMEAALRVITAQLAK